jgi:hypothetical protein
LPSHSEGAGGRKVVTVEWNQQRVAHQKGEGLPPSFRRGLTRSCSIWPPQTRLVFRTSQAWSLVITMCCSRRPAEVERGGLGEAPLCPVVVRATGTALSALPRDADAMPVD